MNQIQVTPNTTWMVADTEQELREENKNLRANNARLHSILLREVNNLRQLRADHKHLQAYSKRLERTNVSLQDQVSRFTAPKDADDSSLYCVCSVCSPSRIDYTGV